MSSSSRAAVEPRQQQTGEPSGKQLSQQPPPGHDPNITVTMRTYTHTIGPEPEKIIEPPALSKKSKPYVMINPHGPLSGKRNDTSLIVIRVPHCLCESAWSALPSHKAFTAPGTCHVITTTYSKRWSSVEPWVGQTQYKQSSKRSTWPGWHHLAVRDRGLNKRNSPVYSTAVVFNLF